jgi:SNF2 family DNA or RNA helicase
MSLLPDHAWKTKYSPEDGDIVRLFYVPALEAAVRYFRTTGYFSASVLATAARGIEGLCRNQGHMKIIVGCTLNPPEVEAIEKGAGLLDTVEVAMLKVPFRNPDADNTSALELLAWMVAKGILTVKVAVPCDTNKQPVQGNAIFHEKSGVIEDKAGNRLAFSGGVNETAHGWQKNWDSFHVFTEWGGTAAHVDDEETSFKKLWDNDAKAALVVDVPTAVRDELLKFLPPDDELPAKLKDVEPPPEPEPALPPEPEPPVPEQLPGDPRALMWGFLHHAPALPNGGERIGEATAAVTPWPHQVRAFHRMYDAWPPKLLIADEVGLGKTIEAGLLLRQAWLAGRAKRILILAPKAVLRQWQIELREKFNLNWPIYDGQALNWYPCVGRQNPVAKKVSRQEWHQEPIVIASSHLMRRRDRMPEMLEDAEPWDIVVLDEAHHARREAAGTASEGGPNRLLRLMHGLKERTEGLVLLTATPMQVDPIEVWDLMNLLGLPPEWMPQDFRRFFETIGHPNPAHADFEHAAQLFQATEKFFGAADVDSMLRLVPGGSAFKANKLLKALRDPAAIPRKHLAVDERKAALRIMRANTPVSRLVSRHTRELLRRYFKAGMINTSVATRLVDDRFIEMTADERDLYDAVEDYISTTYNNAETNRRTAVGFVMTIYRRRLSSSFAALLHTLEDRLAKVTTSDDEDALDDETLIDVMDEEQVTAAKESALVGEELNDIEGLLARIRRLPTDTKAGRLVDELRELRDAGYDQVMVFTQYSDTMDFLRTILADEFGSKLMCFSGRGGEWMDAAGGWVVGKRDDVKQRFQAGKGEILLCTDAAAEGLNFQFCGALVNYDMPWNPMRVEQRIGRIDRLGQKYTDIRIVNLHYQDTVEADVYAALRERIDLFTTFVGRLQPILSKLPNQITQITLAKGDRAQARDNVIADLHNQAAEAETAGFDLDEVAPTDLEQPERPAPLYDLATLNRVLKNTDLLPPGVAINPLYQSHEFAYSVPGMASAIRITTSAEFFDAHPESCELWSPGSPLFPQVDTVADLDEVKMNWETLRKIIRE